MSHRWSRVVHYIRPNYSPRSQTCTTTCRSNTCLSLFTMKLTVVLLFNLLVSWFIFKNFIIFGNFIIIGRVLNQNKIIFFTRTCISLCSHALKNNWIDFYNKVMFKELCFNRSIFQLFLLKKMWLDSEKSTIFCPALEKLWII